MKFVMDKDQAADGDVKEIDVAEDKTKEIKQWRNNNENSNTS